MALTATIYNLSIHLADIDRGVYEKLESISVTERELYLGDSRPHL
jgi:uncharacterized protein YaeQ